MAEALGDALGLECKEAGCDFDGVSLRDVIEGRDGELRIAYSESINDLTAYDGFPNANQSLYAVNDGRWKLISIYEGANQEDTLLFGLSEDPGERRNQARRAVDVAERLRAHLERADAVVEHAPTGSLDPETRARLRALGYGR